MHVVEPPQNDSYATNFSFLWLQELEKWIFFVIDVGQLLFLYFNLFNPEFLRA